MRTFIITSTVAICAVAAACTVSTGTEKRIQTNPNGSAGTGSSDPGAGSGGSGITPPTIDAGNTGGSGATQPSSCTSGPDEDYDQDGWSKTAGDCNDCDKAVNPGAIDVMNTQTSAWGDEDCDGTPGSSGQATCDDGLALDYMDPLNAAKAIELCKQTTATDKGYGLIEAKWVRANGAAYQAALNAGIQPGFGPNVHVQAGQRMLAISSGHARTPDQPNPCGSLTCFTNGPGVPPTGFPQDSPACQQAPNINDDVGLEVTLRAPTNATGYRFNFRFYSFEYPEWVCSSYNDQFIALVNPAPAGAINGNISFDNQNNPVSVNVAFFDVCLGCPAGTADLAGTGFDIWNDAGATVWLQTQAPVTGGEVFTIRFAIWDTGDAALDSTALIDNFEWIADSGTVDVGTTPVPVPQ